MSRGPSKRQRQALALLITEKRSLDVTAELLPMLGLDSTDSTRRSTLRALRLLEERGLVALERVPSTRGGWARIMATARGGAAGELTGAELQRAKRQAPPPERQRQTSPKGTHTRGGRVPGKAPKDAPVPARERKRRKRACERCSRPATHIVTEVGKERWQLLEPKSWEGKPHLCIEHAQERLRHLNGGGCWECERKATHAVSGLSPRVVKTRHRAGLCLPHAKAFLASMMNAREH